MNVISLVVAAVGLMVSIVAVLFARRAAIAAERSAEGAIEQARLLSPRPRPRLYFRRSLNTEKNQGDRAVRVKNIGDSIAYDVRLSDMEVPVLAGVSGGGEVLASEAIDCVKPDEETSFVHRISGNVGPIQAAVIPVETFVQRAVAVFDDKSRREPGQSITAIGKKIHEIRLVLSWAAKDDTKFLQTYLLRFQFARLEAWLEPFGDISSP
jgi:hypothetical protein